MISIIKDALTIALVFAFLLVITHWTVGTLSAIAFGGSITDVADSLLANVLVWPTLGFTIMLITDGGLYYLRLRKEHLSS